MSRILLTTLVAAIAGLLAWAITAPFAPTYPAMPKVDTVKLENPTGGPPIDVPADGQVHGLTDAQRDEMVQRLKAYDAEFPNYERKLIFLLGALIGLAIGGVNGLFQGSKRHALRGALLGVVIGVIGIEFGYSIGGTLCGAIFGAGFFNLPQPLGASIPARILALSPIGLFLGLVLGIPSRSLRQAIVGMIGGLLGAAAGAAVFDIVSAITAPTTMNVTGNAETGAVSRAVFSIALGLGIGLFTSVAQRVTRTAWVRLILGRNEFKEWIVDAPNTFIGRNETAHIPLHGDPAVAPMHAVIQKHMGGYYLADYGSGAPTFLNGQPVQQAPLFSGAIITVGGSNLEFVLKAGSAPQKAAEAYRSQYPAQQGAAAGYQPYAQPQPQAQPYAQPQQQPYAAPQPQAQSYAQPHPYAPTPSAPTQVQPAAQAVGSSALVAVSGPLVGQRFDVVQPFEVGRDCPTIPMSFDTMVSRRHASFSPGPVGIVLSDLGSTNGTFVNDQKIQTTTLRPGDLVKMGVTVFRVE